MSSNVAEKIGRIGYFGTRKADPVKLVDYKLKDKVHGFDKDRVNIHGRPDPQNKK